ncbi:MAG: ArdC-like ssDNA-binding domain-containing protein [Acidobacteriota bacterium]|nr:ArdC-like ssDNA-binding domain-containing protein [Acidobacteriota bacterium]
MINLTPEQAEKREAKMKAFREYLRKIQELSEEDRRAYALQNPVRSVEGRELSVTNQMLLSFQRPGVTLVGGFQQWRRKGRRVKKGETGLLIWFPTEKKSDAADETSETRFFTGNVFDITQTEEIPIEIKPPAGTEIKAAA